ncbi:MAG TPA: hypothetical protein VGD67_19185 [Pseudonocardiaceae bacterium]
MTVLAGVLTAVAMVATATPASAATFDFQTALNSGTAHDGRARIDGSISFFGRYAADIRAAITDVCPADGYGAYAQLEVTSIYGTVGYTNWMWVSDQGCGGTAVYPLRAFYWHNDIRNVRVHLCEIDWDHNQRRGDCAYSTRKDNPYT